MATHAPKSVGKTHAVLADYETVELYGTVYGTAAVGNWRRVAIAGTMLDTMCERPNPDKAKILGMTLRPSRDQASPLLVVRAVIGKRGVVAFQRGNSLLDCVDGFADRLLRGTVDWRDDRPLDGPNRSDDAARTPLPDVE